MDSVNSHSLALVPYIGQLPKQSTQIDAREQLQLRMQHIMDKSLKAHFQEYNYFHRYGMGDIIVLVGTSTAGKSSIIKALKRLENDRIEDGGDLRGLAADVKFLKKYSPKEMEILEKVMQPLDIPNSVFTKERVWKEGVSENEKVDAEKALQLIKKKDDELSQSPEIREYKRSLFNDEHMFEEAFELSRKGRNTIFDVLSVDDLARHTLLRNFNGPMRVVLTYCPFHVLSSRMEKRNQEAETSGAFSNQRIGVFPLLQFGDVYTRKKEEQATIETVTRAQVTKAFDENYDKGTLASREAGHPMPPEKQILIDKNNTFRQFLEKLGFRDGIDQIDLAPRNQHLYHLLINSHTLTPAQSGKILHEGFIGYNRKIN